MVAPVVLATRTLLRNSLPSAGGFIPPISTTAAYNNNLLVPTCILLESRMGSKKFKYFPDRDLKPPAEFSNVVMPDKHRLPIIPKTPSVWTSGTAIRPPRQTKEMWRMRGEELYNTELTLNQFGIVALTGGMLKSKHFDAIRMDVGRHVKQGESFALYRVDPPYKPITNHGNGKRMGGGKGSISEYGTPIKAGRVILEVGGKVLWEEVQPWLSKINKMLPFKAIALNATMLDELRKEEQRMIDNNKNPITFEYLIRNNIFDCQRQVSEYDKIWFGRFCYLDRQMNIKWKWVTKERYKGKK